ncbi:unnamed protein product [Rotaria sp. Silwood1]|nr:unnamed protein product [Rotaria sp. Silwood1]CAF1368180.1 unnamed protein product [Rotaria sp. Silwood1]CAF1556950.1 unnamed protein product [Rotaria sp. Silwood1]CAF3570690.1 unnamed protein product [Rotaria sp. Silwood1]CAF3675033.1 unnamed protein product [Rotaria sp. Silwood1]
MASSTTSIDFTLREPRNVQELADFIQDTMTQIQEKFGQMSDSIMKRIDDMGQQIDGLESNLAHIISLTNNESL